jgi:hypothetical protein
MLAKTMFVNGDWPLIGRPARSATGVLCVLSKEHFRG